MQKYRILERTGEGTFSEVLKAQCTTTGQYVAIKRMKAHFDSPEQVNNLREIQALRRLSPHDNIVRLQEVILYVETKRKKQFDVLMFFIAMTNFLLGFNSVTVKLI
eukprot:GCRY01004175.1.p1 GENE.GCRY01004175.1~~GCRY01004175.1.p1  ORF type:complete len:106 (+),score=14.23 GCRY01004175.1:307-624(+)